MSMSRVATMLGLVALGAAVQPRAMQAQQTRAERSGFTETSRLDDVRAFLDTLRVRTPDIRVGTLGTTTAGRALPLVVAARPMVAGPAEAQRSGKPVVLVQANIHAGEVEGKEVAQMLLRDLTVGPLRPLLDSLVVLVVPVYNGDGNEAVGPGSENRPGQAGPDVVGRRANGQGLDLNRDYVKQEAPETRAAMALMAAWDPDLFMDLHTTNGSYHGYALTYSPGLNPNEGPANAWVREVLLPTVRRQVRARHGFETYWYGNFRNQEPDSLVQGWETYDPRARYGTNWVGLRGRLSVLSEAYSNDPFERRVRATYAFVREVLGTVAARAAEVRRLATADDRDRPDSVTVRSTMAPPRMDTVIAEITRSAGDGTHGFARRERTGEFRRVVMPIFDRFAAARREAMPAGYLLPPALAEAARLLRQHGVVVEQLTGAWAGPGERYRVDSLRVAPVPFEGHRTVQLEGAWEPAELEAGAGWYHVSTDQPRGLLAAYLLEPGSEDGLVAWNMLDRLLRRGQPAPVVRVRRPLEAARHLLPDP